MYLPFTIQSEITIQWIYYSAIGDESSTFSIAQLVGSIFIELFRDGIKHRNEPSPNGKEIFFNSSTGEITFTSPLTVGEKIDIAYIKASRCTQISITGLLPDGVVDVPYGHIIQFPGIDPSTVSNVTAPAWMDVEGTDEGVSFTGTPDTSGTAIIISFIVDNCDGRAVAYSDTINITETAPVQGLSSGVKATQTRSIGKDHWRKQVLT